MESKKNLLIIGILILVIALVGSTYAFFSYSRSSQAFTLTTNGITALFTEKTNQIDFTKAYPISDEFAISNLDKLDYIDFTVSGNAENIEEAVTYEIYLTEKDGNTLSSDFIKVYLTDDNNNLIAGPSIYSSLESTSYSKDASTGKMIYKNTVAKEFTKNYRLYVWLDKDYSQNTVSETFSFYVNLYAHNDYAGSISNMMEISSNPSTNIKFYQVNGTSNGNGLFVYPGTENDEYPIYYYRGNITNNNMIFGGFCWKIVRTTSTGGTKLIYNGVPDNEGHCTAEGDATEIGKSAYNSSYNSPAYVGYNYGIVYPYGTQNYYETKNISTYETDNFYIGDGITQNGNTYNLNNPVSIAKSNWENVYSNYAMSGNTKYYVCLDGSSSCESPSYIVTTSANAYYYFNHETSNYLYGESYSYQNGQYTLTNTKTVSEWPVGYNTLYNNHYTCLNSTGTCDSIKFIWNTSNNNARYITLTNNKPLSEAISEMLTTSTDNNRSTIQGVINTWYEQNLKTNYAAYLEDTAWCNDRTVSTSNLGGWKEDGNTTTMMYFDVRKRIDAKNENNPPKLTCENANDNLSVQNGKLLYPIALLTADEVAIAGGVWNTTNNNYYLKTGSWYWLLSPSSVGYYGVYELNVDTTGHMFNYVVNNTSGGVRPAISLKHGIEIASGTGEPDNPYTVKPLE